MEQVVDKLGGSIGVGKLSLASIGKWSLADARSFELRGADRNQRLGGETRSQTPEACTVSETVKGQKPLVRPGPQELSCKTTAYRARRFPFAVRGIDSPTVVSARQHPAASVVVE
jgi:hypothetical protein